jgi:hypothetical protein
MAISFPERVVSRYLENLHLACRILVFFNFYSKHLFLLVFIFDGGWIGGREGGGVYTPGMQEEICDFRP